MKRVIIALFAALAIASLAGAQGNGTPITPGGKCHAEIMCGVNGCHKVLVCP